jgi:ribonuclease-3 family protein
LEKRVMSVLEDEKKRDVKQLNPIVLAYIGDSVYELFVRTAVLKKEAKVNNLHKESVKYVKAEAQAEALKALAEELTEEETSIIKRARNNKSIHIPKNCSPMDYRNATGFEALIGYLYLTNQNERLKEVIGKSLKESS